MSDVEEEGTRHVGDGEERGGDNIGEGDKICNNIETNSSKQSTIKRDASGLSLRIHKHATSGGETTSRIRELPSWLSKGSEDMELLQWKQETVMNLLL